MPTFFVAINSKVPYHSIKVSTDKDRLAPYGYPVPVTTNLNIPAGIAWWRARLPESYQTCIDII